MTIKKFSISLPGYFCYWTDFNIQKTAKLIAGSDDQSLNEKVMMKLENYLNNLPKEQNADDSDFLPACYKGLPKKYHPIISAALQEYQNASSSEKVDPELLKQFATYAQTKIRNSLKEFAAKCSATPSKASEAG